MRERFEQRLFRIFAQAGYSPVQLLTITPEEMVEIPGITVPNIRAVLCVEQSAGGSEQGSQRQVGRGTFEGGRGKRVLP